MKILGTISAELSNGDIIIGVNGNHKARKFFVKSGDWIFEYTLSEMVEIYELPERDFLVINRLFIGMRMPLEAGISR